MLFSQRHKPILLAKKWRWPNVDPMLFNQPNKNNFNSAFLYVGPTLDLHFKANTVKDVAFQIFREKIRPVSNKFEPPSPPDLEKLITCSMKYFFYLQLDKYFYHFNCVLCGISLNKLDEGLAELLEFPFF